jgi:hypothetical protein
MMGVPRQKAERPSYLPPAGGAQSRDLGERVLLGLGVVAVLGAATFFTLRATSGLAFLELSDETEKFVAAQMLSHGMRLYDDVFAHHGPLSYMLAHLHTAFVSLTDFTRARLIVVALAIACVLAVAASPILRSPLARLWATALFVAMLSSVWLVQDLHMLLYQPIGGFLFAVALGHLALPALLDGKAGRAGAFISGAALASAFFAAFTFSLAAILLLLGTAFALIKSDGAPEGLPHVAGSFILGAVTASALVTLWLLTYGDMSGYFAYHFYFNQVIYSKFIEYSPFDVLHNFFISLDPARLVQTVAICTLLAWIVLTLSFVRQAHGRITPRIAGSVAILAASILMLNPRGQSTFHNGGFVVASLAVFSLVLARQMDALVARNRIIPAYVLAAGALLTTVVFEGASRIAAAGLYGGLRGNYNQVQLKPSSDDLFNIVRAITKPDERVQSLVFWPAFYIYADRLPASGHYYYLPWQAAYKRSPLDGHNIDICHDLETQKPIVVFFDDYRVWNKYSMQEYEPCIQEILGKAYFRLPNAREVFLRTDRAREKWPGLFTPPISP